jgi:hypothetical protein
VSIRDSTVTTCDVAHGAPSRAVIGRITKRDAGSARFFDEKRWKKMFWIWSAALRGAG